MIDTVKIIAEIDLETYKKICSKSVSKLAVDNVENQILYNVTTSSLVGSYDNRISVKPDVRYKIWTFQLRCCYRRKLA